MRCALLLAVAFLGLNMTVSAVMAQQTYDNLPTPNTGFAPRSGNRLPPVTPNSSPQSANLARQPIGSGIPASSRTGQPLGQSVGGSLELTPLPPTQYPAIQNPAIQYPAATPYAAPTYSPQPRVPNKPYRGISDGYIGSSVTSTPSGRLFEASDNDATSLDGPSYSGPSYAEPFQSAPIHGESQPSAPIQNGVTQSGPADQYWKTEAAACGVEGCESSSVCSTPASRWFAGVYAVVMTRDRENNVWLSYDTADIRSRVLNTHDADASYSAGFETRFGRFFGCGSTAFEFVYWGIYPGSEEANAWGANAVVGLDTILHFDGISYDPGGGPQLASTAFFLAERHRLRRNYDLHNIELNLFESNYTQLCGCSNVKLAWAAGLRYVSFDESFLYSTDPIDISFTGALEELHYGIEAENDLLGFQVGGRVDVCFKPCLTSYVDTKVGIFVNRSSQHSRIFGTNGLAEVSDVVSPYFGTPLDIRAEKKDAAFVAEFRTGLDYQFTPCWSATIGYRVVALTGVALSTNQIPVDYISAIDSLRTVNTNGSLIAHGAYAGLEYNY